MSYADCDNDCGRPSAHSACELGPEKDFENSVGQKLNDFGSFFAVFVADSDEAAWGYYGMMPPGIPWMMPSTVSGCHCIV
jgi:hypothetical protein